MQEKNQKEKSKQKKGGYIVPFTIFGLLWGIMSVIFLLKLPGPGNNTEPENWLIWIVFLPALLTYLVGIGMTLSNINLNLPWFIWFIFVIFFGLLLGWLIGITVDGLISLFGVAKTDNETADD